MRQADRETAPDHLWKGQGRVRNSCKEKWITITRIYTSSKRTSNNKYMKTIILTQSKLALVDEKNFDRCMNYKWCASKKGNLFYACAWIGGRISLLHRFILGLEYGDGKKVDHRNGDSLDCREENLRLCTQAQNGMNVKKINNRSSKYKGVSYFTNKSVKTPNRWTAYIGGKKVGKNKIHLGNFRTEIEAALAYNRKAKELFGEFALLNEV